MTDCLVPKTPCEKRLWRESMESGSDARLDANIHGALVTEQGLAALKAMFGDKYMPLSEADKELLEAEQEAKEREMQTQFVETQYRNSGVPAKFYDAELDALFANGQVSAADKDKRALTKARMDAFVQSVAQGKPQAMWLCGKAGTGKTALSCAIMHSLVRRGVKCKYFKSHEIMARLEDARTRSSRETRSGIMKDVTDCSLLVIDEVARWPVQEWEKFMLFSLSDSNYDSFRSAIFISNMNVEKFMDYMGNAIKDRGRGQCVSFNFSGTSLRGASGELYTKQGGE